MTERIILHIDMDAFFISVEERDNPALHGSPASVCGAIKRSVITSANYEARAFGIRAGMSISEARKRCPHLILIQGDHQKYTETASHIFSILKNYTPLVEVASIDEAYLDVTDSLLLFNSPLHIARLIKEEIKKKEKLTCSIGIGPNKLIAKVGSKLGKPDGLVMIRREEVNEVLKDLPVSKINGIGPKLTESLNSMGIFTCGQLAKVSILTLKKRFGVLGERLYEISHGIDENPVIPFDGEEYQKSISHFITLQEDTLDFDFLYKVLIQLSEKVARRMRKEGLFGRRVTLTVRYSDFYTLTKQKTLSRWTSSENEIFKKVQEIFNSIVHPKPIRLLGVKVSNLKKEGFQLELFENREKKEKLLKALDDINEKFGDWTLTWGSLF